MSINTLVADNPFLVWLLSLNQINPVEIKTSGNDGSVYDLILDVQGGRRFGLGIHEAKPYLGYIDHDREAIESIKWTSAAILYNKQGKDWVALSSTDARHDPSIGVNPIKTRLFIPISIGRLAAWKELSPTEICLGHMTVNKNGEAVLSATPFRTLPLKVS